MSNMVPEVDESALHSPQSPIVSPLRGSTNELRKSNNLSLSNNNNAINSGLNNNNMVSFGDEPLIDLGSLNLTDSTNVVSSSGPSSHELDVIFGSSPPSNYSTNSNNSGQVEKLIDFDL